ncbi:hypothetical protein N752_31150 [Desulforamulus aquiferis]|nr:hypothetical protein N752_31150 [Desulforamulus aquiferis]
MARRKFALLKNMLNYMGVESDRVNFTWVSASEGARFAELIGDLTDKVKAIGRTRAYLEKRSEVRGNEPKRKHKSSRQETAGRKESRPGGGICSRKPAPPQHTILARTPEQAENLIWGATCENNLATSCAARVETKWQ